MIKNKKSEQFAMTIRRGPILDKVLLKKREVVVE